VRYALPQLIHGPFGFYPLFSAGEHVILRNSSIRFQGVTLPDVVYSITKPRVAMGPHVRAMCGIGPCDTVCELRSICATTHHGMFTSTLYVQQNLIGADTAVHFRFKRQQRYPAETLAFHVGSRVRDRKGARATVIWLNVRSVRIISDDGHVETWRMSSVVEIA